MPRREWSAMVKWVAGANALGRYLQSLEARLFMSSDASLLNENSWRNLSATGAAVNSTTANSTRKTSWFSTLPESGRPSAPTDAMTARRPASLGRSYHRSRTVSPRIFQSLKNRICLWWHSDQFSGRARATRDWEQFSLENTEG